MPMMSPIPLEEWRAQARHFDFQDQRIAYWTAGAGRPLLLIHGFPTAAWDWSWIWHALAAEHRVIACDLLGFGFSAKPRAAYSLLRQADLQAALLARLDVEDCDLLVHDYGVSVAQELLARRIDGHLPFAIGRALFLNGGMFPGIHRPRLIQKLGAGPLGPLVSMLLGKRQFCASLAKVFGPHTQPNAAELDAFWQLMAHAQGQRNAHRLLAYMAERKQHAVRWVGALETTNVALMHINGAADPVSGEHVYRHWCERLPNHPALLLPGIGHYPQCEAPQRVASAALAFLDSHRRRD